MNILDYNLQSLGFIAYGRIVCDQIKHAKVGGNCTICAEPIKPKTRVRVVIVETHARKTASRCCTNCCKAMMKDDLGVALDERVRDKKLPVLTTVIQML